MGSSVAARLLMHRVASIGVARRLAPIAGGFALLLAANVASAGGRATNGAQICHPGHARLLAADEQAEVFEGAPLGNARATRFACAYGHHRTYSLIGQSDERGSEDLASGNPDYALAGPILAYEASHRGANIYREGGQWRVIVLDLRTGRVLHRLPTGSAPRSVPFVGVGGVEKLVVKGDGAAAWIAYNEYRSGARCECSFYEVRAVDASGSRLLASGIDDIEGSSLALVGSTLYWTQGGRSRSAVLR